MLYNLAGVQHPVQGWGRAEDTFRVLEEAQRLGHDAWFLLGDRDIALHLLRRQALAAGHTLTAVIADLARRLGIAHPVLPMSDQPVRTVICTPEGDLPFQEYFVHRRCQPTMLGMRLDGLDRAHPTPQVEAAIAAADVIVLCPSNPYVSIDPILALPGVREMAAAKPTIAVSPIIGGQALKGPAAKMMAELGVEVSALGVARHYVGLIDGFVLDRADGDLAPAVAALGMQTLVVDTVMNDAGRAGAAGRGRAGVRRSAAGPPMTIPRLAVITPMKPLHLAKQRLRPAVTDAQRQALARDMLTHVLATVRQSHIADLAAVVSPDPEVLALAAAYDFTPLSETAPGYNAAALQGIDWAQRQQAASVLILPADLPQTHNRRPARSGATAKRCFPRRGHRPRRRRNRHQRPAPAPARSVSAELRRAQLPSPLRAGPRCRGGTDHLSLSGSRPRHRPSRRFARPQSCAPLRAPR